MYIRVLVSHKSLTYNCQEVYLHVNANETVWRCGKCNRILGNITSVKNMNTCFDCGGIITVKKYIQPEYKTYLTCIDKYDPFELEELDIWQAKTGNISIKDMSTSHIANTLALMIHSKFLGERLYQVFEMVREFETRQDVSPQDFNKFSKVVLFLEDESKMDKVYNIRIQSQFILTPRYVKDKLGIGFKILETEVEKEVSITKIEKTEDAVDQALRIGFRALARAHHPDLGGDAEVMQIINRAKKEMAELLNAVREK
jgi:hypothetical protein